MKVNFFGVDKIYRSSIDKTVNQFALKKNLNSKLIVNIQFVSKQKIKGLNKKYRHLDEATDVLSFPIWKNIKEMPKSREVILGDIVICPQMSDLDKNLKKLIEHSLNHLIGVHH